MGYMGMKHYEQSDMAAGFMWTLLNCLNKQLDIKENEYNTDGCINVALCLISLVNNDSEEVKAFHKRVLDKLKAYSENEEKYNDKFLDEVRYLIKKYNNAVLRKG